MPRVLADKKIKMSNGNHKQFARTRRRLQGSADLCYARVETLTWDQRARGLIGEYEELPGMAKAEEYWKYFSEEHYVACSGDASDEEVEWYVKFLHICFAGAKDFKDKEPYVCPGCNVKCIGPLPCINAYCKKYEESDLFVRHVYMSREDDNLSPRGTVPGQSRFCLINQDLNVALAIGSLDEIHALVQESMNDPMTSAKERNPNASKDPEKAQAIRDMVDRSEVTKS